MQAQDVVLVKPIALSIVNYNSYYLESVDDESGLELAVEISKAKDDLFARSLLSGDESHRLEPGERPEYV